MSHDGTPARKSVGARCRFNINRGTLDNAHEAERLTTSAAESGENLNLDLIFIFLNFALRTREVSASKAM
jgi:hypothetical protein